MRTTSSVRRLTALVPVLALLATLAVLVAPTADAAVTHDRTRRTDVLKAGDVLRSGDRRVSANGRYRLTMKRSGNLVLKDKRTHTVVWATDTQGRGARAAMQRDGNLVVYSRGDEVLYASGTRGRKVRLVVQDDSNLVIYEGRRTWLWGRAFENVVVWPGHVLRPRVLVRSATERATLGMQGDGNLVVRFGDTPVWSTQTISPGATAQLTRAGQLELRSAAGVLLWTSGNAASPGARLLVLDDGNVVLQSTAGQILWSTGTGGH